MRKTIGSILKIGTLVSTWGLIATVLLQISCRFSWFETPSWTEEASRILFIYAISFAAGLAFKTNYYVHLDLFYNRFDLRFKTFLNRAIPITIFLLFAIFTYYSLAFMVLGTAEKSPSMGFNMGAAFFSMFVMAATICFYAWPKIRRAFKKPSL